MTPTLIEEQAPVAPPAYHRAQARQGSPLQINALTLVRILHLLTLCCLAVQIAHRRCPPPLPKGPGGAPRIYSEESLLLISLLRTLWRLSYADMRDWLESWPALALACGLPCDKHGQLCIPSPSQQCKRRHRAGAPIHESLFVLTVREALRQRLIGARDLIIDSAPILAWRRRDPDAAYGHAPAHHPRPRVIRLDAAYWGLRLISWIHAVLVSILTIPFANGSDKGSLQLRRYSFFSHIFSSLRRCISAAQNRRFFSRKMAHVPFW